MRNISKQENERLLAFHEKLLQDIVEYALDLSPTYHITLPWDTNHRSRSILVLEKRLTYFMGRVEREVLGRAWYRHPSQFIAFGETHANGEYHTHILLKDTKHSRQCWKNALNKVSERAKRTPVPKVPYLQAITPGTEAAVAKYDIKQLRPDRFTGRIDTTSIMPSGYLFCKDRHSKQQA